MCCRDGEWNRGGYCNTSTEPEADDSKFEPEPVNNKIMHEVFRKNNEENRVGILNVTYLTEFRKDGHPSSNREPGTPVNAPQDCSHWCLPGVPDTWNQLLYAQLLAMGFRTTKDWKTAFFGRCIYIIYFLHSLSPSPCISMSVMLQWIFQQRKVWCCNVKLYIFTESNNHTKFRISNQRLVLYYCVKKEKLHAVYHNIVLYQYMFRW